jgi:hypothetical protein
VHQVTRNQSCVSSGKSSAWLPVPADRPERDNSAMGRSSAGPRPHVAMLIADGNLMAPDGIGRARAGLSLPRFLSTKQHQQPKD